MHQLTKSQDVSTPQDAVQNHNEFFFFNDTATTEIYTLSLHHALPISPCHRHVDDARSQRAHHGEGDGARGSGAGPRDRKSTRLNSSHLVISYAVFCLKKKKLSLLPK